MTLVLRGKLALQLGHRNGSYTAFKRTSEAAERAGFCRLEVFEGHCNTFMWGKVLLAAETVVSESGLPLEKPLTSGIDEMESLVDMRF